MKTLKSLVRSYWHGLRKPSQVDADMADEMRFHIEMEAERLVQTRGLDAAEARRRAALNFGGVEKYRGAARDALGFTWARGLSTDARLGMRMLVKSPGLTLVAVFALTLAIGAGAAYLEFTRDLMHGRLPFPGGDRIVGIINWDQRTGEPEHRIAFDFLHWRRTLRAVESLGAYQLLTRSLITSDGRAESLRAVAITANAFEIAGVPPLLGRPLLPDDERPGATAVMVLGHDVFARRFNSDPSIVGRVMKLGADEYVVVGVMPPGFGFPINHSAWVPMTLPHGAEQPLQGGAIRVFGRLAQGVGIAEAQAEVTTASLQIAQASPGTHRHLRPAVKRYIASQWSAVEDSQIQTIVMYAANLFFIGLLALCGANVATLVFARTAARDAEITVRTALGASRARIVGQLVMEALVLTSVAAVLGLVFAYEGLKWVKQTVAAGQQSPIWFWWNDALSPETLIYAAVLAVVAALVVGVTPALKATDPRVHDRLKHVSGGSAAGLKFGGVWTGVIIMQVGVTVIFLAVTITMAWGLFFGNAGDRPLTFAADRYVVAQLNLDRDVPGEQADAEVRHAQRLRARYEEFAARVASEPGVTGIGIGSRLPGMNHVSMPIEVDGGIPRDEGAAWIQTATVSPSLLTTLNARLIAGRRFDETDADPSRHVAIVDRTFVRLVLGGGNAVGRRIRTLARTQVDASGRAYTLAPGESWIEIVGVIDDLTADAYKDAGDAMLYQPGRADVIWPLYAAVRVDGRVEPVMWRLRVIAAEIDSALRLDAVQTLDRLRAADRVAIEFFLRLIAGIGVVAMVLAAAGVYALMSFTVARRTAEIGIRLALGASSRRIMITTFARALAQVSAGIVIGIIPAALLAHGLGDELAVGANATTAAVVCALAATITIVISALACLAPARRALSIQPVDTLKTT